ncbi:PREDICTED: uncharacterized protein LOC108566617 isoform X2 [Nicrophorus vespilloides]|nr:PREDICTED: uncharacterized protein LOC108566617 isoform X2 [Nicrophorus vespilloides]XP_017782094.1 PREDICTED: uncharacterized protein LOC108566617 isoform X2 [Nicrophorus vespilloides]
MIAARKKMRHLGRLTSTLLVFSSFLCCVQSAPAKPLNERSNELTWQAWLLVDDQNQNKQYDPDALIRRRITPKSVFIAPTFSPEALPDCADGFTADNMGKCVKIIEIDKDAHLDFILTRLNEQFGTFEEFADYEDDTGSSTEGPFNVKIPLDETNGGGGGGYDDDDGDTNVAIVVAPTNGNFAALANDTLKFKRGNATAVDAPLIVTKINIDNSATEDETPTTETIPITTTTTTTTESSTDVVDVDEESEKTTTMLSEEAAVAETTTVAHQEEQALFFKVPPNASRPHEEPMTSEDKHTENFVRFPESTSTKTKAFEETQQIISQLLPHANVKSKYEDLNIFNEYTPHKTNAYKNRDTVHQDSSSLSSSSSTVNGDDPKRVFNHRNRDKHWQFPTAWRTVPPQKPLVLRFNQNSKHHAGSFYQHHPRQDQGVYREVPPEDLSYIFGFKRALSHR